jgi:hypothetical protein
MRVELAMTAGPENPAGMVADVVRARVAAVEVACRAITNTVGAFPDVVQVYGDIGR